MADVAALGLAVDSSEVVTATSALERMNEAAARTDSRVSRISQASDALVTALNRNANATDALASKLLAMESSSDRAASSVGRVSTTAAQATDNVIKFTGASVQARSALDNQSAAASKAAASWGDLGAQAAASLQKISAARAALAAPPPPPPPAPSPAARPTNPANDPWSRLGPAGAAVNYNLTPQGIAELRLRSLSSDGMPAAGNRAAAGGRLNAFQAQNLFYQGTDVVASLASGMPLSTIALQQGGQIAPTFMGKDAPTIGGVVSQATDALGGLASRIGLLGGATAAATTAVVAAIAAQQSYASTQATLARQTGSGIGAASGATAAQINAIAASAVDMSRRQAREIGGDAAATGRISPEIISGLIGTAKDYSATIGEDLPQAASALVAALADPAKGAETLNRQLGFLNDTTRENIQRLDAQGDRLGAQRLLIDAYTGSLTKASELTSTWGRVTGTIGETVSNIWDRVGYAVDKVFTGGNLDERLADAQRVASTRRSIGGYLPGRVGDAVGGSLDDYVSDLQRQVRERDQRASSRAQAQRSLETDNILRSLNPSSEGIKRLEDQAENLRRPFRENWIDPYGAAKAAIDGLVAQGRQLKDDMAAGGSAYADAVRAAQFNQRTVGYAPTAQSAAQIDEAAANKRLDAFRNAGTDTDQGKFEKQLASIEQERQLNQDRLRQQTLNSTSAGSGSYSRGLGQAPEQYRDLYYQSALKYGLNPDLLVAQGYQESRFDPRARSAAGAEGIAQFMPGTRRGMGNFDPFDPSQAIPKQAELMAQLMRQFNNDEVAALVGYNAGPKVAQRFLASGRDVASLPEETRNYVREIRRPGEDSTSTIRDLDAQAQAARRAGDAARTNAEFYGKNGLQLEVNTRAAERYQEMLQRGVPASDALRQALVGYETEAQRAARATKAIQFASDDQFERDQLGRTRTEQRAYSVARSRFGDTTSEESRDAIRRVTETTNLTEAKQMITDGASSFVSEFRRTGNAAKALSNTFDSVIDRLLSKALDSVVTSGFSALQGATKGLDLGGIGSFLGFSGGGWTGPGGKYQPAGVVHAGEVVWSQGDVARVGGVAAAEALRRGLPGYSSGGVVRHLGPSPGAPAADNGNAPMPVINFTTQPGVALEQDGPARRRADGSYEQAIKTVEVGMAGRAARGRGPFRQSVGGSWTRTG